MGEEGGFIHKGKSASIKGRNWRSLTLTFRGRHLPCPAVKNTFLKEIPKRLGGGFVGEQSAASDSEVKGSASSLFSLQREVLDRFP